MNGCFFHRVTWARVLCLKPVLFLRIKATIVAFVGKGSVVMFVNTTKLQHFQSHWLTLGSRIKSSAKRFYPFINAFIDAVNIISFPLHVFLAKTTFSCQYIPFTLHGFIASIEQTELLSPQILNPLCRCTNNNYHLAHRHWSDNTSTVTCIRRHTMRGLFTNAFESSHIYIDLFQNDVTLLNGDLYLG